MSYPHFIMKHFLTSVPRVLVAMPVDVKANQDKLRGILHYAQVNGPWDIQFLGLHPVYPPLGSFRNWVPDGVIWDETVSLPPELCARRGIHVIRMDGTKPRFNHWVTHDSRQVAETAADAFLEMGFRHFAYVDIASKAAWKRIRRCAFAARVAEAGFDCHVYTNADSGQSVDWGLERPRLAAWLKALTRPCAVMVAMDLRGRQILDVCREEKIPVPDGIAVIGVDDDAILCENTTPPLASILPDFEGGGFMAAQLLNDLMRGRKRRRMVLTYGVKRFVPRESFRCDAPNDAFAARALEIIRLNACEGMDVPFLVRQLRVSRRYAEIHFKRATDNTLLEAIQKERLKRVCNILRETNRPISLIGSDCGYQNDAHLKRLFKRHFGMSMRDYRKTNC